MKKIAVVMDMGNQSGGKIPMAISICEHLKKIHKFEFCYITTFVETQKILERKLKTKVFVFNKTKLYIRIFNKIKSFFKFLPFDFPFNSYLKKKKIDLVFFTDPTSLVNHTLSFKFIYTILDIEHRKLKKLDEFKKVFNKRDKDYYLAGQKCNGLIVGTQELKNKVSEIYKVEKEKIYPMIFPPTLSNDDNKNMNTRNKKIFNNLKNFRYMIYPAQFWEHKNHIYIINALEHLKKVGKLDFKIIFTGHDKGNLKFIKDMIKLKKLGQFFLILNYVNDTELFYLYKKSFCVIVPTLVAPHTFPLYEAFYFKKPIIYNSLVLDKELKKRVIGLNVDRYEDMEDIIDILKDKNYIKKMVEDNFSFYKSTFNEDKILNSLNYIFRNSFN